MTVPGAGRLFDRIRNNEDAGFLADQSRLMSIRREANLVTAEAIIGITTLGSLGAAPLFR